MSTYFADWVHFPVPDSGLASNLLWPIERGINDIVWVPKWAPRSLAGVFWWNLLLPDVLDDERPHEKRGPDISACPQQCVRGPGWAEQKKCLRITRNTDDCFTPLSFGWLGTPNHHFSPPSGLWLSATISYILGFHFKIPKMKNILGYKE